MRVCVCCTRIWNRLSIVRVCVSDICICILCVFVCAGRMYEHKNLWCYNRHYAMHIVQQCVKLSAYNKRRRRLLCSSIQFSVNIFIFRRFSMHPCRRQHPLNFASAISSSANQPPLSGKITKYFTISCTHISTYNKIYKHFSCTICTTRTLYIIIYYTQF